MVKQFTAKKIQKRNQLMSGIATYGTGISLSTAKTMNIINAKQTNHEKLQNSHLKNPFSRIRKCMKTSILKDYICHVFDNRSLSSADLGKELYNIFKNKTNIEFNSLDNYDQILHSLENQQKSTLNRDIPSILKYIYIEQKLLSFDSDQLFQAIEYFAGIVEVEKLNLWLLITYKFPSNSVMIFVD
nr:unnamed protein product [Naegleria fowleri]